MIELLVAEAILAFSVPYFLLYRSDPLVIFNRGQASWNSVFSGLGLPFAARERNKRFLPLLLAGFSADIIGIIFDGWALVLAGSAIILMYVVSKRPPPYASHEIALPYPRAGRASFEHPEVKAKVKGRLVDVSKLKLFYVSYRNASVFSLPEGRARIPDLLASFLEQTKPAFAWVQIIYTRANVHKYLEVQKWKLLREKELLSYSGKDPAWLSHAEILLKNINEMLSSELFAVEVRGVLVGGDPLNMTLGYSDEADSLAVFETEDPGLLYEMGKKKLNVSLSQRRVEPPFFFVKDLRLVASPPCSSSSVAVAPLGLQVLQSWGDEMTSCYESFELNPVPALDDSFHFPAEGYLELVYDGKLHVLAGGLLGKAMCSLGSNITPYNPLAAFKEKLESLA